MFSFFSMFLKIGCDECLSKIIIVVKTHLILDKEFYIRAKSRKRVFSEKVEIGRFKLNLNFGAKIWKRGFNLKLRF